MPPKPTLVPSPDPQRSTPSKRPARDFAAVEEAMRKAAIVDGLALSPLAPTASILMRHQDKAEIGLSLGELEDRRWSISPSVARQFLVSAGLPYEGRRSGITYSWPSIWRAEGVPSEMIQAATRQSHPGLFEDLLDTSHAAEILGYRDSSSIRKLVATGEIPASAYITFGNRKVYRVRPSALTRLLSPKSGRIV